LYNGAVQTSEKNSILVVDDNAMNIMALTKILGADYMMYVAKNGQDAIDTAKKHSPDLILLDVVMPGIDGFEVITILKREPETRDIPVIFITGLSSNSNEEKGLTLGASDYINKPFSQAVVRLRVKNQLQIVNQMRTIHLMSITDMLTNISNRRHFTIRLQQEWQQAVREKTALGILMLDIDNFKIYNDTYGHLQGDVALRVVADTLMEKVQPTTDTAARWGGEEFSVLLPGAYMPGACQVAEIIREEIQHKAIMFQGTVQTRMTISVGVNSIEPDDFASMDRFVSEADRALYLAKTTGKNKVCTVHEFKQ